jgi:hypothetical protein
MKMKVKVKVKVKMKVKMSENEKFDLKIGNLLKFITRLKKL